MDGSIGRALGAIAASAFGLALVSVIFSQRSQTASVINAGGSAFAGILSAATSPVTGTGGVTLSSTGAASTAASALAGFVDNGAFSLGG